MSLACLSKCLLLCTEASAYGAQLFLRALMFSTLTRIRHHKLDIISKALAKQNI